MLSHAKQRVQKQGIEIEDLFRGVEVGDDGVKNFSLSEFFITYFLTVEYKKMGVSILVVFASLGHLASD